MPVTLAQMAARSASTSFQWEGETVTVAFAPGKVTDTLLVQLDAGNAQRNAALVSVITSWDVLNDDGSMFPLDANRLADLPIDFKAAVMFAVLDEMRQRPN